MKFLLSLLSGLMLFSALTIAPSAKADIYIEPYAGYGMGKDDGNPSSDLKGTVFGGRLGFQALGFQVGGEYMTGSWSFKNSSASGDIKPKDMGAFVGFKFPVLLHVYGTYFFKAEGDATSSGTSSTYDGKGMKLGIGFTGLPLIAINLEYSSDTYTKVTTGGSTSNLAKDLTTKVYLLTVSFPLSF